MDIYLEPGERGFKCRIFLTTVLDVQMVEYPACTVRTEVLHVICQTFWKCLTVLPFLEQGEPGEHAVTVRLEGQPACPGCYRRLQLPWNTESLMFGDMAIYSTCKNNTLNGMPLPDIWLRHGG